MTEVIRYLASYTPYEGLDLNGQCARHDGDYFVRAADLDRVTAERDALQKLLTAADERNDERDTEIAAQVESALRRSFSLGQLYWQQADSDSTRQQNKSDQTMEVWQQHILNVLKSLSAALKPADPAKNDHVCTGCGSKGWTANCSECVPY